MIFVDIIPYLKSWGIMQSLSIVPDRDTIISPGSTENDFNEAAFSSEIKTLKFFTKALFEIQSIPMTGIPEFL